MQCRTQTGIVLWIENCMASLCGPKNPWQVSCTSSNLIKKIESFETGISEKSGVAATVVAAATLGISGVRFR
jgi:hypothetical protein